MTRISLAALSNHNKVLEHLLGREEVCIDARDESGRTALYWASELGHDKIVQMLLDRGADVNTQGRRYGNALQAASYGGHGEIVQMLSEQIKLLRCSSKLEDNPSPSKKRRRGITAEDAAKKFKAAAYGHGI